MNKMIMNKIHVVFNYMIINLNKKHIFHINLCRTTDVQKKDEGTYICTAENQFGSDEASASVVITGIIEPVIAFMSPLVEHTKGETMYLQCNVLVGNPKPVVR